MPKYRVRLAAHSALRVTKGQNFTGPDHRVRVTDATHTLKGTDRQQHKGLLFTVDVNAATIEESFNAAMSQAQHVADLLSAAHSTAIGEPRPLFSLNWDREYPDREIATYSRSIPELRTLRRGFDRNMLGAVFTKLDELRTTDRKVAMRVDRALHFLRRAGNETDPIDVYEDLGDGLQAIDDPLRKKHLAATVPPKRCPNRRCGRPLLCASCGTTVASSPHQFAGTDWVIKSKLGLDEIAAKRVRETRNRIVHQYATFAQVGADLSAATSTARTALIAGIADLLSLPPTVETAMQRTFLQVSGESPPVLVTGVVYDRPLESVVAAEKYPMLVIRDTSLYMPVHESLIYAVTLCVGLDYDADAEWEPRSARVVIPTDPEDESPLPQLILEKA